MSIEPVIVHRFRVVNSEDDPQLHIADPLYDWEHSEEGRWVMTNAIETPSWHTAIDNNSYCYECIVTAKFTPEKYTFWKLKYG